MDLRLLKLLNQRTKQAAEIGRIKRAKGQAVFSPEREESLLQRLERHNRGPLDNQGLRAIYYEVFSSSRAHQKQLSIACLGQKHSDCYLAARSRFGSSDQYFPMLRFSEIIRKLKKRAIDVAVIPADVLIQETSQPKVHWLREIQVCGEIHFSGELFFLLSPLLEVRDPRKTLLICESNHTGNVSRLWQSLRPGLLRTVKGSPGKKRHLVAFELPKSEKASEAVWDQIRRKTLWAHVLGSYSQSVYGEPVR